MATLQPLSFAIFFFKNKRIITQRYAWLILATCLCSLFSRTAFADSEALTLKECYQLALKRSETIAINRQVIEEAEGQFLQSLSGILPKSNYEISQTWQDRNSSGDNSRSRYQRFT